MKQGFPILYTKTCSNEAGDGPASTRLISWSWPSISNQVWLMLGWSENLQPHGRLVHSHPWYEAFSPFQCSLTVFWSQSHTTVLRHTMSIWFFLHSMSCSALCFALLSWSISHQAAEGSQTEFKRHMGISRHNAADIKAIHSFSDYLPICVLHSEQQRCYSESVPLRIQLQFNSDRRLSTAISFFVTFRYLLEFAFAKLAGVRNYRLVLLV